MDKAALEAAEVAWRASIHPTCKGMLTAAIEAYLAALPSPGEVEPVAWQPVELRFHDIMGRFETPQQLAEGLRMSANYWRDRKPSDDAAQPRIMADFHERAAIAIERLLVSPPSEREVIEALKGLLVYTFEDDPGTLILSYDGTALARIDLDTEPGSALLKLEQELAALRASGGTP